MTEENNKKRFKKGFEQAWRAMERASKAREAAMQTLLKALPETTDAANR